MGYSLLHSGDRPGVGFDHRYSWYKLCPSVLLCPDPLGHLAIGALSTSVLDQARIISAVKNLETLTWDLGHAISIPPASLRAETFLPAKVLFIGGQLLYEFLMLLPLRVKELQVWA